MSSRQPNKIYRYQGFSKWTLQTICHDQLYFSDPADFNDPFDCKPTVVSDSDRDTLRNIVSGLIKERVKNETESSLHKARLKGDKALNYAKKLGKQSAHNELANIKYHATNPEYEGTTYDIECRLLTYEIERELLKRYNRGICCFTTSFSNPLLWSHYGEQHNGICVGYDLNRKPVPILKKVKYGGSREVSTSIIEKAIIKNDKKAQDILDENILLRKAPSWKYENEWRAFGQRGVQDSPLSLKDITFGLRCSNAIIHALVSALEARNPRVKFYEIYEVPGKFKLKRREVDLSELRVYLPNTAMSGEEMFGSVL